jgi:hypothetical protein
LGCLHFRTKDFPFCPQCRTRFFKHNLSSLNSKSSSRGRFSQT